MRRLVTLLAPVLLAAVPESGAAQTLGCQTATEIREGENLAYLDRGTPYERIIISGGARITCGTDVELRADSAISYPATGERRFIGRVFYSDSAKTLTADHVDYYDADGRLMARGNEVVLADRKTGSVIRGTEMEYLRARAGRPESRTIVRGRPHATMHENRTVPAAPGDSAAPPLEIDADRMEILGEHLFRATGTVTLVRGETRGSAREAEFDDRDDRMVLIGDSRVEGQEFTLSADRIEAHLQGDDLRDVVAHRDAVLLGNEIRVESPELRVFFEAGELNRMVAVRPPQSAGARQTDAAASPQPRALAQDFWLTADSIDAIAPKQVLEKVVATGNAYGERVADSLAASLPELVAHDWLRGDTITGFFTHARVAAENGTASAPAIADSAATRAVLERLVAVGLEGRARSLYRMREEKAESGQPSINYLVANRIVLQLKGGEVSDVEADGPIQGLHLQPTQARRARRPEDSGGGGATRELGRP